MHISHLKITPAIRVIACFALLLFSISAFSQNALVEHTPSYQPLQGQWLFKQGDDLQWADPRFDDSQWQQISTEQTQAQKGGGSIYAWYRVHFDWTPDAHNPQDNLALYLPSIRHADQTWLNGTYLGGTGTLSEPWQFDQTNPQRLPRVYPIAPKLLNAGENTLAFRVNIGFGNAWGAMYPGGAGIRTQHLGIGAAPELQHVKQQHITQATAIDTLFIVLGLLDIIIILSLLRKAVNPFPEFKWLVVSSFLMLLGSAGHDIFYTLPIWNLPSNLLLIIAMLGLPFVNALYFESQYKNLPAAFLKTISMIWLISCLVILIPQTPQILKVWSWSVWNLIALLSFAYAFYCAFKGLAYRRTGAAAQAIGLIVYFLSIRTQWLPHDFFEHRNIQIGSLFFRYALLFAYFQQIWSIRANNTTLAKKVISVVDKAQLSVARELHDGIGQYLATAKLKTNLLKTPENAAQIKPIIAEIDHAIIGMRRIVSSLHSFMLEKHGFARAIEIEAEKLENTHQIQLNLDLGAYNFSNFYAHHLFRIFQECCHNAIKHGNATRIDVSLTQKSEQLHFLIRDNGRGFDSAPKNTPHQSFGFISLRERVSLMNGQLDIISSNKGTEVRLAFIPSLTE